MKKNRYIPFGYTMRGGRLVIEKSEAEVIRQIYDSYISGSSLKEIASYLTEKKIPYSEKMTGWGKARVARIIDNEKYLGTDEYDKIIDDEVFGMAASAKAARQTGTPGDLDDEISCIRNRIRCAVCGYPMLRKTDKRNRIKTLWSCSNPGCGGRCRINDADLLEAVMRIVWRIKENESLLDSAGERAVSPEADRLKKQFDAELASGRSDDEALLDIIASIAGEEYGNTDASDAILTEDIKRKIRRTEIHEGFDPELTRIIVKSILLGENGAEIITASNIRIGESDGSKEDTEEDRDGDTSEKQSLR